MPTDTTETPTQNPPWWQDLNSNGIPDYREGWFYRAAWGLVRALAGVVPQHTLFARGVQVAEKFREQAAGELGQP